MPKLYPLIRVLWLGCYHLGSSFFVTSRRPEFDSRSLRSPFLAISRALFERHQRQLLSRNSIAVTRGVEDTRRGLQPPPSSRWGGCKPETETPQRNYRRIVRLRNCLTGGLGTFGAGFLALTSAALVPAGGSYCSSTLLRFFSALARVLGRGTALSDDV